MTGIMSHRPKIATVVLLILSMSLFSIGIPLVTYFCPMDDAAAACCQIPISTGDHAASISRQPHSCCDVFIGAERNTTPYRIAQFSQDHDPILVALLDTPYTLETKGLGTNRSIAINPVGSVIRPPLFVLNSSFLI